MILLPVKGKKLFQKSIYREDFVFYRETMSFKTKSYVFSQNRETRHV